MRTLTRCLLTLVVVMCLSSLMVGWAHAAGSVPAPAASPALTLGLPGTVDLSRYDGSVLAQGNTGACAAYAATYLREWELARAGASTALAPLSVYSRLAALYDNHRDTGATLVQALGVMRTYGVTPTSLYPNHPAAWNVLPNSQQTAASLPYRISTFHQLWPTLIIASRQAGIDVIIQELATGHPVLISVYALDSLYAPQGSIFASTTTIPTTLIPAPTNLNPVILTAHSVMADGYDANGVWFENSWGTHYGLQGRAEFSWAYLQDALIAAATDV